MATFKAYLSGTSCGIGGGNPEPPKRGVIDGWSAAAVRRHTRWLYSVDTAKLDGAGDAVTLTLRDIPPTSDAWRKMIQALIERLRRTDGVVRWHWVVEWQRRGAPHLHLAVYSAPPAAPIDIMSLIGDAYVRHQEAFCHADHIDPSRTVRLQDDLLGSWPCTPNADSREHEACGN